MDIFVIARETKAPEVLPLPESTQLIQGGQEVGQAIRLWRMLSQSQGLRSVGFHLYDVCRRAKVLRQKAD